MTTYATRADLYAFGLPRGFLANPGRLVANVYPSTNILELDGHGFEDDTALLFRAEEGGTLPAPLIAGTTYYAIRVTDTTFQVAASAGGSAIDITAAGESVVVSTSLEPTIDAELERYSRLVDTYLPAHLVPLESPYPSVVIASVAKLAAASLLEITGQSSAMTQSSADKTLKELARLMTGIPLRDGRATASANLALSASATSSGRGWSTSDGSIP